MKAPWGPLGNHSTRWKKWAGTHKSQGAKTNSGPTRTLSWIPTGSFPLLQGSPRGTSADSNGRIKTRKNENQGMVIKQHMGTWKDSQPWTVWRLPPLMSTNSLLIRISEPISNQNQTSNFVSLSATNSFSSIILFSLFFNPKTKLNTWNKQNGYGITLRHHPCTFMVAPWRDLETTTNS